MPAKYPHAVKAEAYARDVIDGKIPACKWVKLACQRHFDDKEKSKSRTYKYKFDRAKAERICRFMEKLPHIKGSKFVGKTITLEGWQCFILCMVFGWVRKLSGLRRFRRADIMVPRKNAKSTAAAGVGLYMGFDDNEAGAEVYSGATTEKQAREVFDTARIMVQRSPEFQAYFGVMAGARSISQLGTNSAFKTLIGKPGDGSSPHCHIADEYHEHATDEQVDTMRTGMGARQQPLQFIITTAGDNISGPCFMEFEDAKKILEGTIENDEVFAIIYTIDEDDEWTSEIALRKANPNYGVSIDADYLIAQQNEAIQTPRKQSIFLTKHLNVWVGAMDAYFNIQKWRALGNKEMKPEDFAGKRCIIALDLASKIDIAAMEILFPIGPKDFVRFGKYYLPEETIELPENAHYRAWEKEGWITPTPGEIIDYDVIKDDIAVLSSLFEISEIAYDPWQATQLATDLAKTGAKMVEYRMTVQNMSEPMKQLDALIRSGGIKHSADPVATWSLANVVAKTDAKDNVYPRKAREENKIDPTVALIMALGRAILSEPKKEHKVFFV